MAKLDRSSSPSDYEKRQSSGGGRSKSDTPSGSPTKTSSDGTHASVSKSGGGGSSLYGGGNTISESSGNGGSFIPNTVTNPDPVDPTPEGPTLRERQDAAFAAALARAQGFGQEQVTNQALNQGLIDQYGVLDAYLAAIEQQRAGMDPYSLDNPTADAYFGQFQTNDAFTNALTSGQNRYRADLRNTLNTAAPQGFADEWFGSTMDDAVLQSILDLQQGDAQLVLDRAKARGQLNDVGYGRAMTELGNQGKAGMGSLQSIGSGILQGYRDQANTLYDNALNRAGGATFGQPYSAQTAVEQLNALRSSLTGSLENDIYGAVGGQSFFDTGGAIGRGGSTQGTTNPSRVNFEENPLLASFAPQSGRRTYGSNSGSTASTGAF